MKGPTLKSNLLVSAVAMVLLGIIRPGFHAVVNRTLGPEVNGRASAAIAVIFLASLPATAALPTVMARNVSRAFGAGDLALGAVHARMTMIAAALLTVVSGAGAVVYATEIKAEPFGLEDTLLIVVGLAGYSYWRLNRTLLYSVGKAAKALRAEAVAVVLGAVALGALVWRNDALWIVGPYVLVYLMFAPLTLASVAGHLRGGSVTSELFRDFGRFNLYWFVATAASLATRELAILLLDQRVERALVGELAVALSLVMVLAFAPRVMELPLIHELSALDGDEDAAAQKRLTETGLHWMMVFTFAAGCGAAVLSEPILAIVGDVRSTVVIHAFAALALAFMLEMIVTPATNLMVAASHPAVLPVIGGTSLVAAFACWFSPWGQGVEGVVLGLSISHVVRAVAIAGWARLHAGVRLFKQPVRMLTAGVAGGGLLYATMAEGLDPWIAFAALEVTMLGLFAGTIREVVTAVRSG